MDTKKLYLELKNKRDNLKKENTKLKDDLSEMLKYTTDCDRIDRLYGKTYSRGGYFGRIKNLPDFTEQWKETSFWKYHDDIMRYCPQPLDIIEKKLLEFRSQTNNIFHNFTCKIVAYCDMAIWTPKGCLFRILDPFAKKEIIVPNIQSETMNQYIGRIIYLSCAEKPGAKTLQVHKIEILPYNLYEKL